MMNNTSNLNLVVAIALTALMGCSQSPSNSASGKELYAHYCQSCHTASGTGKHLWGVANLLKKKPSKERIAEMIRHGSHKKAKGQTEMPAFNLKSISESQVERITEYVLVLTKQQK